MCCVWTTLKIGSFVLISHSSISLRLLLALDARARSFVCLRLGQWIAFVSRRLTYNYTVCFCVIELTKHESRNGGKIQNFNREIVSTEQQTSVHSYTWWYTHTHTHRVDKKWTSIKNRSAYHRVQSWFDTEHQTALFLYNRAQIISPRFRQDVFSDHKSMEQWIGRSISFWISFDHYATIRLFDRLLNVAYALLI